MLCLGYSLTSRTVRSEATSILAGAGAAGTQHLSGGFRHQMGGLPATFAEEAETSDRLPANAAHLTALLLGFFGTVIWWFGMSTWAYPGSRLPSLPRSWFLTVVCFLQRRNVATLSEVFRL